MTYCIGHRWNSSLMWVAKWLVKFPAWSNDSPHSDQKCIFASKCLVISLWVWGGLGTSSTMAFVQLNDLRIFLYSERRNEKYHQVTVTHSMWSFWGWAEQFDCSDSSLHHVYKYSMVGIRRWQNPNCYHYCQNPTMVGFWLVGICWLAHFIYIYELKGVCWRKVFGVFTIHW